MSMNSAGANSSVILSSSSLTSEVSDSTMQLLVNVSQCTDNSCVQPSCVVFKKSIESLKCALEQGPEYISMGHLSTLKLLYEHYTDPCSSPNCRVPWCRFISYRSLGNRDELLQLLTTRFTQPMLTLLPCHNGVDAKFDKCIKLERNMSSGVIEWKDWIVLCLLSQSLTVALAMPVSSNNGHSARWVVKMGALQEDNNQFEVLEKLRELQHSNIVSHVWAASCNSLSMLVTCTQYLPGMSLREIIRETGPVSATQTVFYFRQVLQAAQKLHQLDIVYLNWRCSNLLLDEWGQTLKVSNFSASVNLTCDCLDLGTIKLTLPPDIVPVELQEDQLVSCKSDSWGLGCVLHEMSAGCRPWYHLRHDRAEDIAKVIKQDPPQLSKNLPQFVQRIAGSCLQKSPDSRFSVAAMMEQLAA